MGTGVASGSLEPSHARVTDLDDPVVSVELAVRKSRLELPAPHRTVETLEDLGFGF